MRPVHLFAMFVVAAALGCAFQAGGVIAPVAIALCSFMMITAVTLARSYFSYRSFSGRLAKFVVEKQYAEAIALVVSTPQQPLNTPDKINLVTAYYFSGKADQARIIMATVPDSTNVSLQMIICEWRVKLGSALKAS